MCTVECAYVWVSLCTIYHCSWRQAVESSCSRFVELLSQIIWLVGCVRVGIVYFSSYLVLCGGRLMFPFNITNYYRKYQSENVVCSSFQRFSTDFMLLSKCHTLGFYSNSCSLHSSLNDFRPKSNLRWGRHRTDISIILKQSDMTLLAGIRFMFLLKYYLEVNKSTLKWNPSSGYTRGHF